jgi:hypothetical protein
MSCCEDWRGSSSASPGLSRDLLQVTICGENSDGKLLLIIMSLRSNANTEHYVDRAGELYALFWVELDKRIARVP